MDSQDMFADVDVADTQVSQQSKKRKRAECRVRQINVQWSTETVMSLIVEVQKLEPLYNVLHEHYKDRELRNRNWIAVGAGIGVDTCTHIHTACIGIAAHNSTQYTRMYNQFYFILPAQILRKKNNIYSSKQHLFIKTTSIQPDSMHSSSFSFILLSK